MRQIRVKVKPPLQNNRLIALSVLLLVLKFANAQEVYDLSRCIETGLERNFNLMVVRNTEEISVNNYSAGNAGMLPEITATNRFGGTVNTTHQNYPDGTDNISRNIHNRTGSANLLME